MHKCKNCENQMLHAGGIERNTEVVHEIHFTPLSLTTSVVVIRSRGNHSVDYDALKKYSPTYTESSSGDIKTVVFFHDNSKPIAEVAKLLKCGEQVPPARGNAATGHGGVWHGLQGCIGKDCNTPCRNVSCDKVNGECLSHLDAICGGYAACYTCNM